MMAFLSSISALSLCLPACLPARLTRGEKAFLRPANTAIMVLVMWCAALPDQFFGVVEIALTSGILPWPRGVAHRSYGDDINVGN
jgi:hypothetical protein